jgi:tRNA 2-thiocytidine biosynthesis protein TtcA
MDRALREYSMIEPGDRICVGVSGGPDSLSLLSLLDRERRYIRSDFSIFAVHVDLGFPADSEGAWKNLESHFKSLTVDHAIVHTSIAGQAFAPNAKKSPCFICSLLRRKEIYRIAVENGCRKIAYGHHKDDVIETLLINILYGRKIEAMNPVQDVFKGKMQIIRPFWYVDECSLKRYAERTHLPVFPRFCPADGNTRRQRVKDWIREIQSREKNADIRENIFKSLRHVNVDPPVFAKPQAPSPQSHFFSRPTRLPGSPHRLDTKSLKTNSS